MSPRCRPPGGGWFRLVAGLVLLAFWIRRLVGFARAGYRSRLVGRRTMARPAQSLGNAAGATEKKV
jgi:hypothetical protein